jgi:hypothetical protein
LKKKKIYNFSNFYQCKIILIIPIIFLPFLINDESIKRKSSFEFTKEASKNLIKRIKSEKKKSSNNLFKRASSLVDDQFDDSENEI